MKFSNWIGLTGLITSLLLLWSLKEIIILIFAGVIISLALCTLTGKIKSLLPLPRQFCLLIAIISVILILGISMIIVIPQFNQELKQLITQLPYSAKALWEIVNSSIERISIILYGTDSQLLDNIGLTFKELETMPDGVALANGIADSLNKLLNIAGNLGAGVIQSIFVLSISLMISVQPHSYREIIIKLTPSFYRKRAMEILIECGEALSNWMTGVIISSTFVAFLAGLTLYLLGVKLVVANALIAGALNIIPNIGPTISTIFPISVAIIDAPWKSIAIIISYIIIQNLESYIITPSVMQYKVNLLPGLTLTAQFIFTIIFGPIGLLISLPLAVVIQVLIKEIIVHDVLDKSIVT